MPNSETIDDPDLFKIEELVQMHLRCVNTRRELAEHPDIHTVRQLARTLGYKQEASVSKPLCGFVPLTDTMFERWVTAFQNPAVEPTQPERRAERTVAEYDLEQERRQRRARQRSAEGLTQLVTTATRPVPSRHGRPDHLMNNTESFTDQVTRLATPAFEEAVRREHRRIGGDGNLTDIDVVFRDADFEDPQSSIWNRVQGYVPPTDTEAWGQVWLSHQWLQRVQAGDPILVDGVFILNVEHRDRQGRPTYILGLRVVPERTDGIPEDSWDWVIGVATAHITWAEDGTPTATWGIDDPVEAGRVYQDHTNRD